MYEFVRYCREKEDEWNAFIAQSVNGTFLFDRRYMDYHADRYLDASIMAYSHGKLQAVFPDNMVGETLYSHQGLTYGGLVTDLRLTTANACRLMEELNDHLRSVGIRQVVYKAVPWIYHRYPAENILYALHNVCGARITVRHISSAVDLQRRPRLSESRKSGLRKAKSAHLSVEEVGTDGLPAFWEILTANLHTKYGATPVHSQEEMTMLMRKFPHTIRLFTVSEGRHMMGGTLIYVTTNVIHTQYISASPEGKRCGALDLLFDQLLSQDWGQARFFEFGKSSDGDGHQLNAPLIFQKEGFGGRGICYDWYEWNL